MRKTLVAVLLVVIVSAAALAGWQLYPYFGFKCNISGTITKGGQPLQWKSDSGVLAVLFVPLDRDKDQNVYRAMQTDSKTGAYAITGIPAGSYRVSIQQMDPYPTHDLLGFALGLQNSPILRDVKYNNDVIDIDLAEHVAKKGRAEPRKPG